MPTYPWQTQPDIPPARQAELRERLTIIPDIAQGIYPFHGFTLTRADVEWLLSQLPDGPVDWSDERQHARVGLDLRGALLSGEDLSRLPLARTQFGLSAQERLAVRDVVGRAAAAQLVGVDFSAAHLEGASFYGAQMQQVNLSDADATAAYLSYAHLTDAKMPRCTLAHANVIGAHLENVDAQGAVFTAANLSHAHLEGAWLREAHFANADLSNAYLECARMWSAYLEAADLRQAHGEGAILEQTHLENANLKDAHLEGANLTRAHLEGADLDGANLGSKTYGTADPDYARICTAFSDRAYTPSAALKPATLRSAFFSPATTIYGTIFGHGTQWVSVIDVHWGGLNLAVVKWPPTTILGDEVPIDKFFRSPDEQVFAVHHAEEAVRANRQFAKALRDQGMDEQADIFAYRAQLCQRQLFRLQANVSGYLGMLLLDLLAGHGYKPARSFLAYIVTIVGFMLLYLHTSAQVAPHLTWNEAFVLSMSSFHGRGFFTTTISLGDAYAQIAVLEAFVGLMIEVSFIATFTKRFFSR